MRANIYIRKDNEKAWKVIDNKSDWVNKRLTAEYQLQTSPPITIRSTVLPEVDQLRAIEYLNGLLNDITLERPLNLKKRKIK